MKVIVTSKADIEEIVGESVKRAVERTLQSRPGEDNRPKEWLTNREAQDFLGLSRATLQRYRDRGILPYSKVGGNIYYRYADVVTLLEDNFVGSLRGERS